MRRGAWAFGRWLLGDPEPGDAAAEADRLIAEWGSLASDIAQARSDRDGADWFDGTEASPWRHVARAVRRMRRLAAPS